MHLAICELHILIGILHLALYAIDIAMDAILHLLHARNLQHALHLLHGRNLHGLCLTWTLLCGVLYPAEIKGERGRKVWWRITDREEASHALACNHVQTCMCNKTETYSH
jgi:hypothetical protein